MSSTFVTAVRWPCRCARASVASGSPPTHNGRRSTVTGAVVVSSLSISRAWDETRDIFRRDGGLYVAVALALIVLPEVVVGIIAPDPGTRPSGIVQFLRLIAGLIALVG